MPQLEIHEDIATFIEADKCALVVWDVQKALVKNIFNLGEFISNVKSLIAMARTKEVPIFFTKTTPLPQRFESAARRFFMKGRSRGTAFTPEGLALAIEPQEGDTTINKNTASIFVGTNFDLLVRNAGLSTIVFSGIATEMGIESSARDALNRGFFPVVVRDAVSSSCREAHERSLQNLSTMMAVISTSELIAAWKRYFSDFA